LEDNVNGVSDGKRKERNLKQNYYDNNNINNNKNLKSIFLYLYGLTKQLKNTITELTQPSQYKVKKRIYAGDISQCQVDTSF
jgi:hypothetical protein